MRTTSTNGAERRPARGRRSLHAFVCLYGLALAWPATAGTWLEDFSAARLDPARWQRTLDGDVRSHLAEPVPARAPGAYRLRLEADTRGTRDDEVKSVGVGSRCALTLGPGTRVRVVLDWTPAANASYLAGAIVLSPHATTGDPAAGADWLSVGYVGVPPGNHARLLVVSRVRGQTRTLFDDGFPATNRVGRPIGRVELEVAWREETVEVREDGRVVHRAGSGGVPFTRAHVYLQLASHSNFPARPVHFEHLRVSQGEEKPYGAFPSAPGCEERAHEAEGAAPARR